MQEKYINPPTDACMFHMHPWVLACFMCVAPKLTKSLLFVTNVICNKKKCYATDHNQFFIYAISSNASLSKPNCWIFSLITEWNIFRFQQKKWSYRNANFREHISSSTSIQQSNILWSWNNQCTCTRRKYVTETESLIGNKIGKAFFFGPHLDIGSYITCGKQTEWTNKSTCTNITTFSAYYQGENFTVYKIVGRESILSHPQKCNERKPDEANEILSHPKSFSTP
jgi:hypothetical protein